MNEDNQKLEVPNPSNNRAILSNLMALVLFVYVVVSTKISNSNKTETEKAALAARDHLLFHDYNFYIVLAFFVFTCFSWMYFLFTADVRTEAGTRKCIMVWVACSVLTFAAFLLPNYLIRY